MYVGVPPHASPAADPDSVRSKQPSLAERIALLNQAAPISSSSSSAPTTPSRNTGAATSISDKIKKFQQGTSGEAPLVPTGSFGLGGTRREPSSGNGISNRVASLGGGRAAVPLGVVKPFSRSVSVGSGAQMSRQASTSSESTASSVGDVPAATAGDVTGLASPPFLSASNRLDSFASTTQSISSMIVETGSDSAVGTPTSSAYPSPLSSPLLSTAVDQSEPSPIELNNTKPEIIAPTPAMPGPLAALRGPQRTNSGLSVSSMLVEDGSVTSEDGDDSSSSKEKEKAEVPATIGGEGTEVEIQPEVENEEEIAAPERSKTPVLSTFAPLDGTNKALPELAAAVPEIPLLTSDDSPDDPLAASIVTLHAPVVEPIEKDTAVTPPPLIQVVEPVILATASIALADELATPRALVTTDEHEGEDDGGYGDLLDDFAASEPTSPVREVPPKPIGLGMPKVKCSDCSAEVDLMELADHTCTPMPVVKEGDDHVPRPHGRGSIVDASHFPTPPSSKPLPKVHLDTFVRQSHSLVPEDVGIDDQVQFISSSSPQIYNDVPDSPLLYSDAEHEPDMFVKKSPPNVGREGKGKYHDRGISGFDSEDEEGYQGGSAIIIRSSP